MNFISRTINSQKVFYRYYRRKGFRRFLKENILETDGSNKTKALSVALGIFIGISPIWGFHTAAVFFLAAYFRLNKMLAFMCTHISVPPLIPFIIMLSLWVGAPFVPEAQPLSGMIFTMETVKEHLVQYLIGSIVLASFSAAVFGGFAYLLLNKLYPEDKKKSASRKYKDADSPII